MTEVVEMVARLEQAGGKLALQGDCVRYVVPTGDSSLQALLAELRKHRDRVKTSLLQRAARQATLLHTEADRERLGQSHAKLFPFIGRKVRTPAGPGTLMQVFAQRVMVLLDSDLHHCSFFTPNEIAPVSLDV